MWNVKCEKYEMLKIWKCEKYEIKSLKQRNRQNSKLWFKILPE